MVPVAVRHLELSSEEEEAGDGREHGRKGRHHGEGSIIVVVAVSVVRSEAVVNLSQVGADVVEVNRLALEVEAGSRDLGEEQLELRDCRTQTHKR